MTIFERFRKHAGWTQAELAAALGASKAAVSFWEAGERTIKPATAHKFLAVANEHGFSATLQDVFPAPIKSSAA